MVQPPFEIFLVPTWLRVPTWSGTLRYLKSYELTSRPNKTSPTCHSENKNVYNLSCLEARSKLLAIDSFYSAVLTLISHSISYITFLF